MTSPHSDVTTGSAGVIGAVVGIMALTGVPLSIRL